METIEFNRKLAELSDINSDKLNGLTESLTDILISILGETDSIAIPGFGTLEPVKEMEKIEVDARTGNRYLVPPSINIKFNPGSRLKKAVVRK